MIRGQIPNPRKSTTDVTSREIFAEIERLSLQQQVLELEEYGYTVVERLLDDRVFEEILMNETMLALASYLLGRSFQLSSMTCHARGPKNANLPFHTDTPGPAAYSPHCIVANCNFALVDYYTKEAGCISIVPRSHLLCRQPVSGEGDPYNNPHAKPIEVPAGSMILYHGNTWHGAYRRDIPGIRMNLAVYMCRSHVVPQERIRESVTPEMLARNNARFAQLCADEVVPEAFLAHHANNERMKTLLGRATPKKVNGCGARPESASGTLRERMRGLVQRRLRGEKSLCEDRLAANAYFNAM